MQTTKDRKKNMCSLTDASVRTVGAGPEKSHGWMLYNRDYMRGEPRTNKFMQFQGAVKYIANFMYSDKSEKLMRQIHDIKIMKKGGETKCAMKRYVSVHFINR